MNTNEFARILLTWIKSFLSWIGIPRDRLNELDEIIFLILIVVIAFAVGAVFHYLSVRFTRKVLKYKNISFLSSLIEYNALRKMSAVIPPLIISALLPFAFDYRSTWFTVSEKITWIYFFIALLFSVNAVLNSVGNVLMNKEQLQNRPGLVGYIAKDGDSLWSIAKENHTTVEDILRDNHRTDEDLRRGEKILIVKKVELNSYES